MTPNRLLTTALLSLSIFTISLSEAKAAQVEVLPEIQEPQWVALKFKKSSRRHRGRGFRGHGFRRHNRFQRRHRGFRSHGFRRSPSFGHRTFKAIKKPHFDHDQKHHDQKFDHDQKFHHNRRGFFR